MRIGIPPGRGGLILLAAAVAPIVLKKAKPFAKAVSRTLIKAGEAVERYSSNESDRNTGSGATPGSSESTQESAPNAETVPEGRDVKEEKKEVPPTETSSPIGHEEVREQSAEKDAATAKPKKPAVTKKKREIGGATAPQNNPKRSRRTPPPDIETA